MLVGSLFFFFRDSDLILGSECLSFYTLAREKESWRMLEKLRDDSRSFCKQKVDSSLISTFLSLGHEDSLMVWNFLEFSEWLENTMIVCIM